MNQTAPTRGEIITSMTNQTTTQRIIKRMIATPRKKYPILANIGSPPIRASLGANCIKKKENR